MWVVRLSTDVEVVGSDNSANLAFEYRLTSICFPFTDSSFMQELSV